jgi:hypothetical protein
LEIKVTAIDAHGKAISKAGLLLRQSPPRSPSGPVSIGDPGADFVNDGINGASAAAGVAPSACAYRRISQ